MKTAPKINAAMLKTIFQCLRNPNAANEAQLSDLLPEAFFAYRAVVLLNLGIPVIPLHVRSKEPRTLHAALDGTTDPKIIAQWARQHDPASNCAAVARFDGFWPLDDDLGTLAQKYKEDTGLDFPFTFKVKTARGFHYYFKHDDASRAVRYDTSDNSGVIDIPGFKGEARCHNQYVVGPYSVHPSGALYIPVSTAPIVPAPAALLEWLQRAYVLSESLKEKSGKPKIDRKADPGFGKLFDAVAYRPLLKRVNALAEGRAHIFGTFSPGKTFPCPMPQHKHTDYSDCFGAMRDVPELLHCLGNCQWTGDMVAAVKAIGGYSTMYNAARAICMEEKLKFEDFFPAKVAPVIAEPVQTPVQTASSKKPTTAAPAVADRVGKIVSRIASEIVPVPINWLWEPYLQEDALNAYYGNPSVGKGNISMDNIACLTTGRWFPTETNASRSPMNCIILNAEEGAANTIVPRLIAAQADLKRVRIMESVHYHSENDKLPDRMITLQDDIAVIRADLEKYKDREEKFLVLDPITNYVGDINFNQDGEVRPVLTLLKTLAEEMKITILIIGHFNKNSNVSGALDKPGGGRAWTAVPRTVWGFFKDPEDSDRRMMINLKMNNAKEANTGLVFAIANRIIGTKPNGKPWGVSCITWAGTTDSSADQIVAAQHPEARRDSKGSKFIADELKAGVRRAVDVYRAAEKEGISESTLKRACDDVEVLKFKNREWFWQHPDSTTPIPDGCSEMNKYARARYKHQLAQPLETGPVEEAQSSPDDPELDFRSEVRVSK